MFNKILVCLDGSKLAEQILPYVESQAACFNSEISLIKVVGMSSSDILNYTGKKSFVTRLEQAEKAAKEYLETVAGSLRSQGILTNCIVLNTSPVGDAIVNYAQNQKHDLIAIATHGHGGLGRLLLGSVADYILQKSGLPVLVIRPK